MTPSVALFIDAENLSVRHADVLLKAVSAQGRPAIVRAYGDATRCSGWETTAGLQFVHTRAGRNCADIALTIDAVDFHARGLFGVAVLASSDSDFSRLADHLRERGVTVLGFGEAKAPDHLRQACDTFEQLEPQAEKSQPALPDRVVRRLETFLTENGGEALVSKVNAPMYRDGIHISELQEKDWQSFLRAHPDRFDCDPRGPNAKVRLRSLTNK